MPVHQRLQALLALLVVTFEALGVALEDESRPSTPCSSALEYSSPSTV